MSFHLLTFTGSQTASVLGKLNAIPDPAMTTTNNNYLLPVDYRAKFAYAMSATLANARITSPSIGANFSPLIRPFAVGAAVPNDPPICSYLESPLLLPAREGIEVDTTATGPEQVWACIGPAPPA